MEKRERERDLSRRTRNFAGLTGGKKKKKERHPGRRSRDVARLEVELKRQPLACVCALRLC